MITYLRRYLRPALLVGFDMADVEDGAGGVVDKVLDRLKVKKADRADVALDGDKEQAAYALLDFYMCAALLPLLGNIRDTEKSGLMEIQVRVATKVANQAERRASAMGYAIPKKDAPTVKPTEAPTG